MIDPKFKIGDKVLLFRDSSVKYYHKYIGKKYRVKEYIKNNLPWFGNEYRYKLDGCNFYYLEKDLRLVNDKNYKCRK
jgi:hypothetical protein